MNKVNGETTNSMVVNIPPEKVREELSKHILVDGYHLVMDLNKSSVNTMWDAISNTEILDLYTSFATTPLGYNHPKLVNDEKFMKQLIPAAINKIANADIYTTQMANFVKTFARVVPEPLRHHQFFISGGALAVENALKTAFDWKVRKNLAAGKGEKGTKIIHFKHAFHGRSGYTLSLTNTEPAKTLYFPKFDWPRIVNPVLHFEKGKITAEEIIRVSKLEVEAIEQIKKALKDNPDDIAGLIVEPIQGEGGDGHFRPEFLRELRKLADENEFLLIFDEVQTGFGTTGTWWCFEQFGVIPDIFAFGKKTQICGICVTRRIDDVDNVFKVSSRLNSTWGGSLTDMIRCTRYVEVIEEDHLLENATKVGKVMLDELIKLEEKFSKQVTNARGRGLFLAVDLPDKETRNKVLAAMRDQSTLALPSGERAIRFRPSLVLDVENAISAVAHIEKALEILLGKST